MTDEPIKTFTLTVHWPNSHWTQHDVVAFEPQENAYLATTSSHKRIIIPFGTVLTIEVEPND